MKYYKQKRKNISKKAHQPDPARNDHYHQEDTPYIKKHTHKTPHGKFRGKRWSPQ